MFSLTNILLGMCLMVLWMVSACVLRSGCVTLRTAQPTFSGAMLLVLLSAAGAVATHFALGMTMGMSFFGLSVNEHAATQARTLLALPVWMLVCATVYKCLLPTTFGRAMVLFIAQAVIIGGLMIGFGMLANATQQPNLLELRQMLPM